jgi:hypothetical protein
MILERRYSFSDLHVIVRKDNLHHSSARYWTASQRFRSQSSPCVFCGGKSDTGVTSSQTLQFFTLNHHSAITSRLFGRDPVDGQ